KRSSSQSFNSSLYKQSFPQFTTIFGKFATSPSAITSNRDLFVLCFECLSLFVKHKVTKEEDGEEDIEVILDKSSIKKIIDSFLPQMIKVESVLRMNGEMAKEEEEEEEEEEVEQKKLAIFPQFYSLLSKILTLGEYKKLENSFIEDILEICRKFSYSHRNSTKDSLLFILLPHILPWMRKYPDKKFFLHWTNILKKITLDEGSKLPHEGRSSQLWFVFHPVLDVIKDTDSKGVTFDDEAIVCCLLFFANLSCIPSQAIEIHECIKDDLLDSWFELIKERKEEDDSMGIIYWSRLVSILSDLSTISHQLSPKFDDKMKWIYNDSECYGEWMFILSKITLSSDDETPDKSLCSEAWPLFHPVLDVVKREFVGVNIVKDDHERFLKFFSNLCCDLSHAIEIYHYVEDLLDGWFEAIKKNRRQRRKRMKTKFNIVEIRRGIVNWSMLISNLSSLVSIVPQISLNYYDEMYWCHKRGGSFLTYKQYVCRYYPSLKKWVDLIGVIKGSLTSNNTDSSEYETLSKLYDKHRDEILSVFLAHQSKSEIEEHKRELSICFRCLRLFVCSRFHCLLIPVVDNIIDTFFDHLSRVEVVLKDYVDEYFLRILQHYSDFLCLEIELIKRPLLFKIIHSFQRFFERGIKGNLEDNIALYLLHTLRNISFLPLIYTKSSILTLIKPYIRHWLRIYNDSKCFEHWIYILSNITSSSDNETPDKSLCSEAWPLFHPVLDVVKREFEGEKIVGNNHEEVLHFFSNLCCDPAHTIEVYDNVKDLLDEWIIVIKRGDPGWFECGYGNWGKLISMFSTVPSLVPLISPKYDVKMMESRFFDRYFSNISSYIASSCLAKLLHSIPPVSLIPSTETFLYPEKDGYSYASHVCCQMSVEIDAEFINCDVFDYCDVFNYCFSTNLNKTSVVNIITKKEMTDQQIIQRGRLCFGTKDEHPDDVVGKWQFSVLYNGEKEDKYDHSIPFHRQYRIKHSSIIQYTPPQHLLVKMPFDEERSLRQSVYDFVEHTGGGVESLFDHEMCNVSFEGYDQESWREGMEILEEEEEEEEEEFSWPGLFWK
ncbi:hypothetical protein ADUPG1_007306, partial [Aduncisulcus paluster]